MEGGGEEEEDSGAGTTLVVEMISLVMEAMVDLEEEAEEDSISGEGDEEALGEEVALGEGPPHRWVGMGRAKSFSTFPPTSAALSSAREEKRSVKSTQSAMCTVSWTETRLQTPWRKPSSSGDPQNKLIRPRG